MTDNLVLYYNVLVPLRHCIGNLIAGYGNAQCAHVVDELAEGVLCPLCLLLVVGVNLDSYGIYIHIAVN